MPVTITRPARSRTRRVVRGLATATALVVALAGCRYNVALLGDVPYSTSQEPAYERLIDAVNQDGASFSIHVGDFQASTSDCTDAVVQKNIGWFDSFAKPLIFTPGDNDWTDCSDPLVRLDRLRQMVFRTTGTESRGVTTKALISQASYPENARWEEPGVTFVTIHVVGSSDGNSNSAEFTARRQANLTWLQQAFASSKARNDKGIVVMAQGDLRMDRAEGAKGAYESIFLALRSETQAFPGQVLYVHGDGHTFKNDQPMVNLSGQTVTNFRRVEVYGGTGTVRWVKLAIDDKTPGVFTITSPPTP